MRRYFLLLIILPLILACPMLWKLSTQGFRIEKVRISFPFHPEWEAKTPCSIDLQAICREPFSYVAKGSQCYVFQNSTKEYVLKIFRSDLLKNRKRRWLRSLYAHYVRQRVDTKTTPFEAKIKKTMCAAWLAYEKAPDLTGVVYLHLNEDRGVPSPSVTLVDRIGRSHHIPLQSFRFVIQKKGDSFRQAFARCRQQPEKIQQLFDQFFTLLVQRVKKQIINTDHNLSPNFGFVQGSALEIDFGNYRYSEELALPEYRKREFHRFADSLCHWAQRHAPEWQTYLEERILQIEQEM